MVYNLLVQNNSFEIGLPGSFSQLHHFLVVGPQYCYLTLCLDSSFEKKKGNNCIPLLGLWHGINTGSMLRTRGHSKSFKIDLLIVIPIIIIVLTVLEKVSQQYLFAILFVICSLHST